MTTAATITLAALGILALHILTDPRRRADNEIRRIRREYRRGR